VGVARREDGGRATEHFGLVERLLEQEEEMWSDFLHFQHLDGSLQSARL
jgi:hypothetical protein